jgi:hypothetical protein
VAIRLHSIIYKLQITNGNSLARLEVIGNAVKQRQAVRYDLRLPVIFHWNDRLGGRREQLGQTRDLSIINLFVQCSAPPLLGTLVELEVHIPSLYAYPFELLIMKAKGRVIRIAGVGDPSGFAVITTSDFVLCEAR